jgi:hypothetical protein
MVRVFPVSISNATPSVTSRETRNQKSSNQEIRNPVIKKSETRNPVIKKSEIQ